MNLTLRIWRQTGPEDKGRMVTYQVDDISPDMSFLEMLDVLNEQLILDGEEPVAFDHDCREGICGTCGLVINGDAHGPQRGTTTCQLHMRHFTDGDTIDIEPWRARAFPVIKDLVVDRDAFDRIIQAGGYITAPTGSAPEAHATPVPKADADAAFERGRLHRLRRLRGGLPERLRHAVHRRQGHPPRRCCRRASRSATPGCIGMVDAHGRGRLRRLHQHRRVRRGLPEGHPAEHHRPAQPRLPQGHHQARRHPRLLTQFHPAAARPPGARGGRRSPGSPVRLRLPFELSRC